MRHVFQNLSRKLAAFAGLVLLTGALSLGNTEYAWAVEQGTYTVTVTPKYRDPETGVIEDPGNNEAVGQGMCERMCGSTGLLEVEADGTMYLTVRYYLSSFVHEPTFEERTGGGSFGSPISYQTMQVVDPVEGAKDIEAKYGYTDFRIRINSLDSVFRGKAYINPPGKNVVYFFTAANPVAGSGDFITNGNAQQANVSDTASADTQSYSEARSAMGDILDSGEAADEESSDSGSGIEGGKFGSAESSSSDSRSGSTEDAANGSGSADDPVTGIPKRPSDLVDLTTGETRAADTGSDEGSKSSTKSTADENLSLQTKYDLSSVDLKKAHKLSDPILAEATGIAGTTEGLTLDLNSSGGSSKDTRVNGNKLMMTILLLIGAGLLAWFGVVQVKQMRRHHLPEAADFEAEAESKTAEAERTEAEMAAAERETNGNTEESKDRQKTEERGGEKADGKEV